MRALAVKLAAHVADVPMSLFLLCRPGFEPECAAEITDVAAQRNSAGFARTQRGWGYVVFETPGIDEGGIAPFDSLIFARQKLTLLKELRELPAGDRATPIVDVLRGHRFGELWVEHPDSDEARTLSGLARSFGNALRPVLRAAGVLAARNDARLPRLHVVMLSGTHAVVATSLRGDSSPWPLGIPRLRLPSDAPSRSALKLEEALVTLLSAGERERWLRPGMRAADLGAAPGGWSWVLARNGLQVIAIDNGPLAESALATGLVRHQRADGFTWQPPQPLDWMVCDMVEQPRRVAARMAEWFAHGWCRRAIFNLKLPMKKRYAEVRDDLADFVLRCDAAGAAVAWRARQLYHDREEITVFAGPPTTS